jgi:hypothetical protein
MDRSPALRTRPRMDAFLWWELRRPVFNVVVLVTGLASLVLIMRILPGDTEIDSLGVLAGCFLYGVAANACYMLGWLTELVWSARGTTVDVSERRNRVYRTGLVFSVLVTLSPPAILYLWGAFGG